MFLYAVFVLAWFIILCSNLHSIVEVPEILVPEKKINQRIEFPCVVWIEFVHFFVFHHVMMTFQQRRCRLVLSYFTKTLKLAYKSIDKKVVNLQWNPGLNSDTGFLLSGNESRFIGKFKVLMLSWDGWYRCSLAIK